MTQSEGTDRGLFSKYRVEHPDGRIVPEAHFILRPDRDPHAAVARLAAPAFVDGLASHYVVRKFLRWAYVGGPAGEPVYGEPLPGAVPLPLGVESDADPGYDMAGTLYGEGPVASVRRVLTAYADSCERDNPVLARDLREIVAFGLACPCAGDDLHNAGDGGRHGEG